MLYTQEVRVKTNMEDTKVGEQMQYKVLAETPADTSVSSPGGQTSTPLETVKTRMTDTLRDGGRYRLMKEYYLT